MVAGFFSWWAVHGWLMVVRGFVGLFVADGCSWCCGGLAWLMVVRGGFFWCRG